MYEILSTEKNILKKEMDELYERCEKVRKGQYAKIGELTKMYNDLKIELDVIKKFLCKNPHE